MFARRLLWGVALVAVLAQGAGAIMMHDGARTNPSWQQEYKDLGCQYNSVVGIYGYNGTAWQNIGSGTVISDHCVIGAAHSALFNNGNLFTNYAIVEGNNLSTDAWAGYYTTSVTVSPQYTGIGSTDIAIWSFADTITNSRVQAAALYTGSDSALIGSVVDQVGFGYYGYPSVGAVGIDGAKRGCQNVLEQLGYPIFGYGTDQLITHFVEPGWPGYQHLGGCTMNYDSGGGWFVNGELVAVNDWTVSGLFYGAPNGATSVSQHLNWINSVTGLPEPGTVAMLGIGIVLLRRKRK